MTRRSTRLAATALVVAGLGGIVAVLSGWMSVVDGSLAFPAAVIIGLVVLHRNRPRTTFGPPPQQGADARKGITSRN